jgi:hypothetical protein
MREFETFQKPQDRHIRAGSSGDSGNGFNFNIRATSQQAAAACMGNQNSIATTL